jgi:hypothetical protein
VVQVLENFQFHRIAPHEAQCTGFVLRLHSTARAGLTRRVLRRGVGDRSLPKSER